MDENNNKINLTIENYTGEKPIVIVYREGVAGKVLDEKAPVSTDVAGVLSTPLDWLRKRVDTIEQKKAKILVEREKYTITLMSTKATPTTKPQSPAPPNSPRCSRNSVSTTPTPAGYPPNWGNSYASIVLPLRTKSSA